METISHASDEDPGFSKAYATLKVVSFKLRLDSLLFVPVQAYLQGGWTSLPYRLKPQQLSKSACQVHTTLMPTGTKLGGPGHHPLNLVRW